MFQSQGTKRCPPRQWDRDGKELDETETDLTNLRNKLEANTIQLQELHHSVRNIHNVSSNTTVSSLMSFETTLESDQYQIPPLQQSSKFYNVGLRTGGVMPARAKPDTGEDLCNKTDDTHLHIHLHHHHDEEQRPTSAVSPLQGSQFIVNVPISGGHNNYDDAAHTKSRNSNWNVSDTYFEDISLKHSAGPRQQKLGKSTQFREPGHRYRVISTKVRRFSSASSPCVVQGCGSTARTHYQRTSQYPRDMNNNSPIDIFYKSVHAKSQNHDNPCSYGIGADKIFKNYSLRDDLIGNKPDNMQTKGSCQNRDLKCDQLSTSCSMADTSGSNCAVSGYQQKVTNYNNLVGHGPYHSIGMRSQEKMVNYINSNVSKTCHNTMSPSCRKTYSIENHTESNQMEEFSEQNFDPSSVTASPSGNSFKITDDSVLSLLNEDTLLNQKLEKKASEKSTIQRERLSKQQMVGSMFERKKCRRKSLTVKPKRKLFATRANIFKKVSTPDVFRQNKQGASQCVHQTKDDSNEHNSKNTCNPYKVTMRRNSKSKTFSTRANISKNTLMPDVFRHGEQEACRFVQKTKNSNENGSKKIPYKVTVRRNSRSRPDAYHKTMMARKENLLKKGNVHQKSRLGKENVMIDLCDALTSELVSSLSERHCEQLHQLTAVNKEVRKLQNKKEKLDNQAGETRQKVVSLIDRLGQMSLKMKQ